MKLIKKEIEIITNKKPIGYIDNGDYSIKYTYKLFGLLPVKKIIKK